MTPEERAVIERALAGPESQHLLWDAVNALRASRQPKPRYFVQERGVDGYAVLMRWGDGTGPFFALCPVRADAETICERLNRSEP